MKTNGAFILFHPETRIQSFFSFKSGPPESYGEDLALLASLIADGKLHPQIGSDKSWRELAQVMTDLREQNISLLEVSVRKER